MDNDNVIIDSNSEYNYEEFEDTPIGNSHYIITDSRERVIEAWSDGPYPTRDTRNAICLTQTGSYQFKFGPTGEDNPTLFNDKMIPLYKWNGRAVIARTTDEIAADEAELPTPTAPVNPMEEMQQQLLDIQLALCDVYEMMCQPEGENSNG